MKAGKLRHRITVFAQTLVSNGAGGDIETFSEKGACWSEVKSTVPPNNEEILTDRHLENIKYFKIKTRENIGFSIVSTDVLYYKSRLIRIQAISDIEERGYGYSILAKEIGGDEVTIV